MLWPSILVLAAPMLAAAAPTSSGQQYGTFHVSDFSYTCSNKTFCSWGFQVNNPNNFSHHPAETQLLHCHGNTTMTDFIPGSCTDPKTPNYIHINSYVHSNKKSGTRLFLQYLNVPHKGSEFFWGFLGNATVTTGSKQPRDFLVHETSAFAST